MKKIVLVVFLSVLSVGLLFNLSWAACSEDLVDLGICDTLFVRPYPTTDTCVTRKYCTACDENNACTDWTTVTQCINKPGEKFPCFLYVNLLVTHDSNTFYWSAMSKWVQDSISAIVVPLGWTRTNPAKYCSLSTYWNSSTLTPCEYESPVEGYPNRIWRNFPPLDGDSINLMGKLKWTTMIADLSSDSVKVNGKWTPPHAFISTIAQQIPRKWGQVCKDTLFATLTFRIEDTMHVCIDTTLWPLDQSLQFVRYDAAGYIPRTNLFRPDYPDSHLWIWVKSDGSVNTYYSSVEDFYQLPDIIPKEFALSQNYPNPFNPTTTIEFAITEQERVTIGIFNTLGQRVETLVNDKRLDPGTYRVVWNAGKAEVASGIYFYCIETESGKKLTKKLVLLK